LTCFRCAFFLCTGQASQQAARNTGHSSLAVIHLRLGQAVRLPLTSSMTDELWLLLLRVVKH